MPAKLDNFDHLNPDQPGGWPNGGAPTRDAWEQWAHRRNELVLSVAAIRAHQPQIPATTGEEGQEAYVGYEGRSLYQLHHRYERHRKLVAAKKVAVRDAKGCLAGEVCGFDSQASFGIERSY